MNYFTMPYVKALMLTVLQYLRCKLRSTSWALWQHCWESQSRLFYAWDSQAFRILWTEESWCIALWYHYGFNEGTKEAPNQILFFFLQPGPAKSWGGYFNATPMECLHQCYIYGDFRLWVNPRAKRADCKCTLYFSLDHHEKCWRWSERWRWRRRYYINGNFYLEQKATPFIFLSLYALQGDSLHCGCHCLGLLIKDFGS